MPALDQRTQHTLLRSVGPGRFPTDGYPAAVLDKEPALSIKLLGALSVSAGGATVPLPTSRKTRALLGYLILSGALQRRDQLCEMFWEVPDDPRGALRWSLSKLRRVINFDGTQRIESARERLAILLDDVEVDLHGIKACAEKDCTPEALSAAWQASAETLLEDCELVHLPSYSAWLQRERKNVANMRASFAKRMTFCDALAPEDAVLWADRWLGDRPFDAEAARAVVTCLRRVGRIEDASQRAAELDDAFRKAGLMVPSFDPGAPGEGLLPQTTHDAPDTQAQAPRQTVRFSRTPDDVILAWGSIGADDAPPLVKAAHWPTHLELDGEAPMWSPIHRELAAGYRLIRYDERGCGMSDRDVAQISFGGFVTDLETVVDSAGLDRFPLLGIGHGAAVSIEYAARHPDRVSHLILFGGYPAGWRHVATPAEVREREAMMVLIECGWERATALSRSLFSATYMPDATQDELAWFDEFVRRTASPRSAVHLLRAVSEMDVRHRLAELRMPTLVIHSRDDQHVPLSTGREMASAISDAQFITLRSKNHLLLGREPAAMEFIAAVRRFLAGTQ